MNQDRRIPLLECPRCDEADFRAIGPNVCGLCGFRFFVKRKVPLVAEVALQ